MQIKSYKEVKKLIQRMVILSFFGKGLEKPFFAEKKVFPKMFPQTNVWTLRFCGRAMMRLVR